ncbi:MAG: AbrB/MazE/SpoVT family DNA-binding domain-containing protein, partial [Bacillota bacterium]
LEVSQLAALLRAKFLGATTVGERGQIVIPADARKEYGLEFGDKILVFGRQNKLGLLLVKDDVIARYVDETMAELSGLERLLEKREAGQAAAAPPAPAGNAGQPKPRPRTPRPHAKHKD